jgi:glutamate---cysteine ligase / carboxylate-amine ligase
VRIRSVGVEEEFLVFDVDAPRLLDIGPDVVAAAEREGDDDAQFEKELKKAQAELASAPTDDIAELERDLRGRRSELVEAAAGRGARLVASGTCAVPGSTQTTEDTRYRQMAHRYAAVERQQLVCAMHVHVDVDSDDEGVAAINGIAPWLPVLVALSANSPFADGADTGYASYRHLVWNSWPTAGVTAPFDGAAGYHDTVQQLIASGAARDRGMIYFDARLSATYPTVEIRVCDVVADPADVAVLAALCRALVSTAATAGQRSSVRPELLRAAGWRAARWGMTGDLVDLRARPRTVPAWELVDALLDTVGAALESAGDTERTKDGLARIRKHGTGAERQRAAAVDGRLERAVDAMTLSC